jgi:hypothetical protein
LLALRGKVPWQGDLDALRCNRVQVHEARNHQLRLTAKALV